MVLSLMLSLTACLATDLISFLGSTTRLAVKVARPKFVAAPAVCLHNSAALCPYFAATKAVACDFADLTTFS
jgi:hypothetical protein